MERKEQFRTYKSVSVFEWNLKFIASIKVYVVIFNELSLLLLELCKWDIKMIFNYHMSSIIEVASAMSYAEKAYVHGGLILNAFDWLL
ncbi:unnamed protein product [Blepharisma stoltei]|uniref:Uncharacterized protein n=1 Tax=Blepharisma stoltei TaxID=1481888 RepID=A0AAU9K050_9CILI|nr:unnamed protein product [Blepharisma stoltei]